MLVKNSVKTVYYLVVSYFFIWIILFEFVLPVNQILPKPSIVFQSFPDLWSDYNLPLNYLSTVSIIYCSLFFSYYLVKILAPYLKEINNFISVFIYSLEWFSEYVPGIIIGLLLIFWLPESQYIGIVFAFGTAFTSIMIKFQKESENIKEEYIVAAQSLGFKDNKIIKLVIWKEIQPRLMEHIFNLHYYIWSVLIIFEFIKGGLGLGTIFKQALKFNDLSAIFSVFLIIGISVFLGKFGLKNIRRKFFFWS